MKNQSSKKYPSEKEYHQIKEISNLRRNTKWSEKKYSPKNKNNQMISKWKNLFSFLKTEVLISF